MDAFLGSKSVEYLMSTGQLSDLNFILEQVDDVDAVFPLKNSEIVIQQDYSRFEELEIQSLL